MRRKILLMLVMIILCVSLHGCGGGGVFGQALRIAGVRAIVEEGSQSGSKWVRILADIVSGNGLVEVVARILGDDDKPAEVLLIRNATGQYEANYEVKDTSVPKQYAIEVIAEDAAGTTATSDPVVVEVPADQTQQ